VSIDAAQTAIVTTLTGLFPDVRKVAAHGGRFTESDLLQVLGTLPAVLVACLGITSVAPGGRDTWEVSLRWAVYCLHSGANRDQQAMQAAYAVVDRLPSQLWGLGVTGAKLPDVTSIQAANLYSGEVKGASKQAAGVWQQVALWAVTWTQVFIISKGT
jgi:hypothetical protein